MRTRPGRSVAARSVSRSVPQSVLGPGRGERGVALSSPLALLSVAAVALAAVAFVSTDPAPPEPVAASAPVTVTATPTPTATATPARRKPVKKRKDAPVRRGKTYVDVYNNSGIDGLAGSVAARAQGAGWQVVGADNWYGTVQASTVYYPARLREAARLLAKDLGIARTKPIIAPMGGDRLTVILTADYV